MLEVEGMGRIQSIQSFSTLDGPGTRCVVFFQGCPVGCLFCHNPESWEAEGGEIVDPEDLLLRLERFRPFLQAPPGLTITGGEPLFQPEFALKLANSAKKQGWHVALDTSGWGPTDAFLAVVENVDLVMFSIKHPLKPKLLSRLELEQTLANWKSLTLLKVPVWLRYVLIKNWTDQPETLHVLGELAKELPNLEKIEIFPYNSLAESNWQALHWDSPIFHQHPPAVTEEEIKEAELIVKEASGLPDEVFSNHTNA